MGAPTQSEEGDSLAPLKVGLATRRLVVRAQDVVFVKGILEAHDGLAHVFAAQGGDLVIAAAPDRDSELEALVQDLAAELGGITSGSDPSSHP